MNLHVRNLCKKLVPDRMLLLLRDYRAKFKLVTGVKRLNMLQFEVHLADHCNLNCKSCNHFSPLAEEKYMEITDFENDCKRLGELTAGKVRFIRFMGGEPLLHNQITQFLETGRAYFPKAELIVVTNGIFLLEQHESFWKCCHDKNVYIQVSNYPVITDRDAIKTLAKKHKVTVDFVGGGKKMLWHAMKLDENGQQNVSESFRLCAQSNAFIQLYKGKLFTCPTPAYIQYFNAYFDKNLQVTENDYVDIYKAKDIDEILDFLCNPIPFCKYCNVKSESNIAWDLSEKDINEWT